LAVQRTVSPGRALMRPPLRSVADVRHRRAVDREYSSRSGASRPTPLGTPIGAPPPQAIEVKTNVAGVPQPVRALLVDST
jgi:hypothetical protein